MNNDIITVIFSILLIILIFFLLRRKNVRDDYDERQTLARSKAYKYGFATIFAALPLFAAVYEQQDIFAPDGGLMLCLVLGILVFGMTCVFTDAFESLRKDRRKVVIILALGICNLMAGINGFSDGRCFTDGRLNYLTANLMIGAALIIVALCQLIRSSARNDGADEE